MVDYIVKDLTIIFSPNFNEEIEPGLLVQYSNVIFSNYELNEDLFKRYESYDFNNLYYIGSIFNQPVNLHPNLTHLKFGYYFNQQVNLHPKGCSKNSTVGGCSCCPEKITYLTFGWEFNQKVNLPLNLTHLNFGNNFNQQVNLPPNLTHLTFGEKFNQQVNLPLNIKYLNINCNNVNIIDYLPESVEKLVLGQWFNLELNNLSSSIKKLVIKNHGYNHELNCLPNNLEYLELPRGYDKEIKKYPKQLKTLKCHKYYKYIDEVKVNDFEIETYD